MLKQAAFMLLIGFGLTVTLLFGYRYLKGNSPQTIDNNMQIIIGMQNLIKILSKWDVLNLDAMKMNANVSEEEHLIQDYILNGQTDNYHSDKIKNMDQKVLCDVSLQWIQKLFRLDFLNINTKSDEFNKNNVTGIIDNERQYNLLIFQKIQPYMKIDDIYDIFPYRNMYLYQLFSHKDTPHSALLIPNFIVHHDIAVKAMQILKRDDKLVGDYVGDQGQLGQIVSSVNKWFDLKNLYMKKCQFKYKKFYESDPETLDDFYLIASEFEFMKKNIDLTKLLISNGFLSKDALKDYFYKGVSHERIIHLLRHALQVVQHEYNKNLYAIYNKDDIVVQLFDQIKKNITSEDRFIITQKGIVTYIDWKNRLFDLKNVGLGYKKTGQREYDEWFVEQEMRKLRNTMTYFNAMDPQNSSEYFLIKKKDRANRMKKIQLQDQGDKGDNENIKRQIEDDAKYNFDFGFNIFKQGIRWFDKANFLNNGGLKFQYIDPALKGLINRIQAMQAVNPIRNQYFPQMEVPFEDAVNAYWKKKILDRDEEDQLQNLSQIKLNILKIDQFKFIIYKKDIIRISQGFVPFKQKMLCIKQNSANTVQNVQINKQSVSDNGNMLIDLYSRLVVQKTIKSHQQQLNRYIGQHAENTERIIKNFEADIYKNIRIIDDQLSYLQQISNINLTDLNMQIAAYFEYLIQTNEQLVHYCLDIDKQLQLNLVHSIIFTYIYMYKKDLHFDVEDTGKDYHFLVKNNKIELDLAIRKWTWDQFNIEGTNINWCIFGDVMMYCGDFRVCLYNKQYMTNQQGAQRFNFDRKIYFAFKTDQRGAFRQYKYENSVLGDVLQYTTNQSQNEYVINLKALFDANTCEAELTNIFQRDGVYNATEQQRIERYMEIKKLYAMFIYMKEIYNYIYSKSLDDKEKMNYEIYQYYDPNKVLIKYDALLVE